jgi:tetratricopeptide (TPR) repeat protein
MNERFLFMPSLGFCIAAGYLFWKLYHGRHGWMKPAAIAIAAIYVLGFAFQTLRRVPVWKNAMTLNSAAIKVSKNSARANCFMATAIYNKVKEDKSLNFEEKKTMMHEADSMLDISLEMIPAYYSANQMKSGVAAEIYNMDRDLDRLLAEFRGIIEDKPNIVFINEYMEYLNGRNVDKQKLLDFYYDAGYNLLARKHRRPDYAVELLKLGFALDPNNARINYAIGKIYTDWGRTEEGTPYLTKAYTLDPSLRNQQ